MEEIEQIFKLYDTDNKGQIEVSQLAQMFEDNGINVNEEDLMAIFNIVDDDQNGTLSLDEFKKFLNSEDAQMKFRNIALQMRQRIEDDYQMLRIAEKQYLPLNFNKMLSYLFQKTVYRQTLKQLSSQDIKNKNTVKDMNTFIQLFSGKNDLVVDSSNLIENQSVASQFKSFSTVKDQGDLEMNKQQTFQSESFEGKVVNLVDLKQQSNQQQSYRSTNVSQNAIIEIDNLDSNDYKLSKNFSQNISSDIPDVKIKRIRQRKTENPIIFSGIEEVKLFEVSEKRDSLVQRANFSTISKVKSQSLVKIPHIKLLNRLEGAKNKKVQLSPIIRKSDPITNNQSLRSLFTKGNETERFNYKSFKILPSLQEKNLKDQDHRQFMNESILYLREGFRKQLKESNYIPGISHHPFYNQKSKLSETLIPKRKETHIKRGMFELVLDNIKDQQQSENQSIISSVPVKPIIFHRRIQSQVDFQSLKACNIIND